MLRIQIDVTPAQLMDAASRLPQEQLDELIGDLVKLRNRMDPPCIARAQMLLAQKGGEEPGACQAVGRQSPGKPAQASPC